MHPLPAPKLTTEQMYADSSSRIRASLLKARYLKEAEHVLQSSELFVTAAEGCQIDQLKVDSFQPNLVSQTEMCDLYDKRVRQVKSPGRKHYDELIAAVPHKRCPYCGERRIKSIDHYLPKAKFSLLAVTPANLVPACSDCNHAKGSYQPSDTEPALIHPYFDDVENSRWLFAIVNPATPPAVDFEVRDTNLTDEKVFERLRAHFRVFELELLFKAHAGQVINELDARLPAVYYSGGAASVREHLLEESKYRSIGRENTWQRALFEGLADSDWYCSEYFAHHCLAAETSGPLGVGTN